MFGAFQVLALAVHDLGAVETDGLNFQPDFPFAGFCQR
jgi:hypothetical protein